MYTLTHKYIHIHPYSYMPTHSCTQTHIHTIHAQTLCAYTQKKTNNNTYTLTRTYIHPHAYTKPHTHKI